MFYPLSQEKFGSLNTRPGKEERKRGKRRDSGLRLLDAINFLCQSIFLLHIQSNETAFLDLIHIL
jgi:hypothetical protein